MKELSIKDQLKAKIKSLRDRKMLPMGYGKLVAQMVIDKAKEEGREVKCSVNSVNQVASGNSIRLDIVEALIELAENSREQKLLNRINKLLEDEST